MTTSRQSELLLLVAGAKGAVASTLAVAVTMLRHDPKTVLSNLTTSEKFPYLGLPQSVSMTGWDQNPIEMTESIRNHGVLPDHLWGSFNTNLNDIFIKLPPSGSATLHDNIQQISSDIEGFKTQHQNAQPVFVNLLPASSTQYINNIRSIKQLYKELDHKLLPDMAYTLAAISCGVPVVNFSPNILEIPAIVRAACKAKIPICGRDGKTGQTYLKVVLASAFKARNLYIDGWYSLNILGNADGKNLEDPGKADGKLRNKTETLDDILGYPVGERYESASHKVRIDYYPPRGDSKEAWDVIDFMGLFGLPMSLRLNLQGRDSILAAPMVLDLARWMAALQRAGKCGLVPELGFFFKKPIGESVPHSFQDQVLSLAALERFCDDAAAKSGMRQGDFNQ